MNTIHTNYEYILITSSMLLQLHRDLYKFLDDGYGGKYISLEKIVENSKESSYG